MKYYMSISHWGMFDVTEQAKEALASFGYEHYNGEPFINIFLNNKEVIQLKD